MEFEGRVMPFRCILPESGNGTDLYILCAYTNPLPKIQDTTANMKVKVKSLSRVRLCDPWTVAHQAPPSMGFSRQ